MPKQNMPAEEEAGDEYVAREYSDGARACAGEGVCTSKRYTRVVGEWAGVEMEVWTPVRDEVAAGDYAARLNHVRDTLAASGGEVAA